MNKCTLIIILIISVFIQACATGRWESRPDRVRSGRAWPDRNFTAGPGGYERNYQLGVKKSAFIGQEIIHVKKYEQTIQVGQSLDSATITARYKFSNIQLMIDKNRTFTLHETINIDGNFYLLPELNTKYWHLLISADGRISQKSLYNSSYEMVYTPHKEISVEPQNFKLLLKKTYDLPSFSFDLIYTGINDVSLNTTYREYTKDDLAKPAFFQSLTYKADAKQIRFKDFLIQIHEVTNEKIIYTVLEDGLK